MPLDDLTLQKGRELRAHGLSWGKAAAKLGVPLSTLRYNLDADYRDKVRGYQKTSDQRRRAKGKEWKRKTTRKKKSAPTPNSPATPGAEASPRNRNERRRRARDLSGTALAERIERRVQARLREMEEEDG